MESSLIGMKRSYDSQTDVMGINRANYPSKKLGVIEIILLIHYFLLWVYDAVVAFLRIETSSQLLCAFHTQG